jgi:hypothetical protein
MTEDKTFCLSLCAAPCGAAAKLAAASVAAFAKDEARARFLRSLVHALSLSPALLYIGK